MSAAECRLTVFMPVKHFHPQYLRQAVASVFAQTRPDWRLLIVADPAEGRMFASLLAGELEDPRVSIVDRDRPRLAGAYNTAMRVAGTDFIAALLADDMLAPEACDILLRSIEAHPGIDFFHTGRYFIDGDGRRLSSDYLPPARFGAEDFCRGSPVKHLMCWRRATGIDCGGVDESLDNFGSDDWDFPWTMYEHGATFCAVRKPLYVFRDHRDWFRLTTHVTRDVQLRGLKRILEKHGAPEDVIAARTRRARGGFLRQSLFSNPLHRWLKERIGYDPRHGWRERYH